MTETKDRPREREYVTMANFNEWLDRLAREREEADAKFREERAEFKRQQEEAEAKAEAKFLKERAEFKRRQEEAEEKARKKQEEADAKFREERAEFKRQQEEAEAKARKEREEADRRQQEAAFLAEQRMKQIDKSLGRLTNRIGEIIEHLVTPNVLEKFKKMGFSFDSTARNIQIQDQNGKTLAEIDTVFQNGEDIMIVEVKTHPTTDDIGRHVKRMTLLKTHKRYAGLNLYGAIAAAVIDGETRNYAIEQGFYVLEQSGDTMKILPDDPDFKPKRW
ncbi:MAG: DUF4670 domain-containing protein [Spirochaetaceae bacterium]|nr:DUF4670 domain-containing protein [Spirochaetaceae bacterium]